MTLSCPHCHLTASYGRSDFNGNWAICRLCETPFSWRRASGEQEMDSTTRQAGHAATNSGDGLMKGLTAICILAALAAALFGVPAVAQQGDGAKALSVRAENLMAGDARHQELAEQGGDPSALLPGDVVHYQLVFTNITDVPVRNVEFTDPIPVGLAYVAESAACDREDVEVSYSVDGGATYTAQPMVDEIVDGVPVRRPASADQYTHIRWLITGWVQPGAQVVVAFQAQMPGDAPGASEPSRETS